MEHSGGVPPRRHDGTRAAAQEQSDIHRGAPTCGALMGVKPALEPSLCPKDSEASTRCDESIVKPARHLDVTTLKMKTFTFRYLHSMITYNFYQL